MQESAALFFPRLAQCTECPRRCPSPKIRRGKPVNPYGTSKLFLKMLFEAYDRAYGMRYMSLRYFNAAGADEAERLENFTIRRRT